MLSKTMHTLALALVVWLFIGTQSAVVNADQHASFDDPVEYNAPYQTTPQEIVEQMLDLAKVDRDDLVYDLGSGDGRIVITAAKKYGARGIGLEIDPELVQRARRNAERARVQHLVEFRVQDLFTADLSNASVVTLYLLPEANLLLMPKLQRQLKPGSRIVSHDFGIGEWEPDDVREITDAAGGFYRLKLWRIPLKHERPDE